MIWIFPLTAIAIMSMLVIYTTRVVAHRMGYSTWEYWKRMGRELRLDLRQLRKDVRTKNFWKDFFRFMWRVITFRDP